MAEAAVPFSLSVTDALALIGVLITSAGVIAAVIQIRANARAERARFLLEIIEQFFADEQSRALFHKLDYDEWRFDPAAFQASDNDRLIDQALYTLDIVGHMVRRGTLGMEEVRVLAFRIGRVLENPEVLKYLAWLDQEYERMGMRVRAHGDARFLGARVKQAQWSA